MAYFYISFNDVQKQQPEIIVRSLAAQLAAQKSKIPESLIHLHRCHKNMETQVSVWLSVLYALLSEPGQTYLFLDALDECSSKAGDRKELLDVLRSIQDFRIKTLHTMVTSRKVPDISKALGSIVTEPPLGIQDADVEHDIQVLVRSEVRNNAKLSRWPQSIQDEIVNALVVGSRGM